MNTLIIKDLLGNELRSRQSASVLRKNMTFGISLDFEGINFMSRSFADELYNLVSEYQVKLVGMSDFVRSMFDIVSSSRAEKRVRMTDKSEIKSFSDINSLSDFLVTL